MTTHQGLWPRCASAALLLAGVVSASAAKAESVAVWHAMSGKAGDAMQAQCARFNASQAQHQVRCGFQGDYARLMQKTVAAFRSGRQPALVQFFDVAVRELIDSGAIQPVSSLYGPADQAAWTQDLLEPVHDWYAGRDGQLVGQPYNVSTVLLYVNDTRLRAAGVPQAPATWEALRQTARALQASGARCAFVTDLDAWANLEQVAAAQGLGIAEPQNGRGDGAPHYALTHGPIREHLQWIIDGQREGWLRLDSQTKAGDATSAFRSGECAMLLAATGMWSGVLATIGTRAKVSVHPIPLAEGTPRHRTHIGGAAFYVMRGLTQAQRQAAAAFLRFIRQPDEQLRLSDATGFLPYTHEAVRLRRERGAAKPLQLDAVEAGLASLAHPASTQAPGLRLGFYPQFRAAWKEEVQRAIVQGHDATQTLERLERRGNALLRRYGLTYAARTSEVTP